jgi:predicted choloylglycine hydrolase
MSKRKITRREFIKGALLASIALILGGGLISGWLQRIVTILIALFPRAPRPLPPDEHAQVISAARADDLDGMPALYLSGTHYEMGYQHGTLAREMIQGFRRDAYAYMTDLIQQELSLPHWLARLLTRPLLYWQAAAYQDTIPHEYLEEAQGVADGAGVHTVEVVLVTAIWEMYLASGCSEFVVADEMTADGSMIHGFNYDLMSSKHALINPYLAMIFYRPAEGVPFSTLNTVGSIGVNAGMSDAGLSVAWDNTHTRDDSLYQGIALPVVPFIITLRRILEYCRSLDEAVHLVIDTLPRPLADIIIVGSAGEGQAIALETAGHMHATRPLEGGAVWSTNHFRTPELAPHDRRSDWREVSALGEDEYISRFARYAAYATLLEQHRGRITPRLALDFLRDPYPREAAGTLYNPTDTYRTTICRAHTSFSVVMQPGLGLIWSSDGKLPAPQGRFFAFDQRNWQRLPDLDFPATGFRPACAAAGAYLRGEVEEAWTALEEALAADGETAPLLLMRALLWLARGDEGQARADAERVVERWGETEAGAVARAWMMDQDIDVPSIPFPSAIAAWLHFHATADADGRV